MPETYIKKICVFVYRFRFCQSLFSEIDDPVFGFVIVIRDRICI